MPTLPFTPTPDVAAILNALLDSYERHEPGRPFVRVLRVRLDELKLSGYTSQLDPAQRQTTNEQMQELKRRGFVHLAWQPGEVGHLLDAVTLLPERVPEVFPWLGRVPVAAQAAALRDLLFGGSIPVCRGRLAAVGSGSHAGPASCRQIASAPYSGRSQLQPRSTGRAGGAG